MKQNHSYKSRKRAKKPIKEKDKRYISYYIPPEKRKYGNKKEGLVVYKTLDKRSFEYFIHCLGSGDYVPARIALGFIVFWLVYRILLETTRFIIWGFKKLFPSLAAKIAAKIAELKTKAAKLKDGVEEWIEEWLERINPLDRH